MGVPTSSSLKSMFSKLHPYFVFLFSFPESSIMNLPQILGSFAAGTFCCKVSHYKSSWQLVNFSNGENKSW
jgi:hypothetical protein